MAAALDVSTVVAYSIAAFKHQNTGWLARRRSLRRRRKRHARLARPTALSWPLLRRVDAAASLPHIACRQAFAINWLAQISEAHTLLAIALEEPPERALSLYRRAYLELLPPAMAVLERRRLTDTLLYGKCAPHEVEWRCQILASLTSDYASAVTCAPFVGYEAYLHLARAVLLRQRLCPDCLLPSAAQEKQIISCAQMALKLMSAPRLHEDLSFSTEALLLHEARCALFEVVRMSRSHHTALRAAMDNLQASGTITRRRMERVLQDTSQRFR